MESNAKKEFFDKKSKLLELEKKDIYDYLFYNGYYGERYTYPPIFNVLKYNENNLNSNTVNIDHYDLLNIEVRHTETAKRIFSLIHPDIYCQIVDEIVNNWAEIINHIYNDNLKVYSYSFPITITNKNKIDFKKSKTMIYNFLTLEEKIAYDSYNYKYILITDISKFYHSIYTHSIAWALYGDREIAYKNKGKESLPNHLDKLFQKANHKQTNGIPIGPVVSDIIAEIVLAGVDKSFSENEEIKKMDFISIRYKDDYRFLVNTKEDAEYILETLEKELQKYNLWLNKEKTNIYKMPAGLERKWKKEYNMNCDLSNKITMSKFQDAYNYLIEIEEKYPGTAMLSKFFDSLIDKKGNVIFSEFALMNKIKVINLLSLLVDYSPRILPQLLSIIELLILHDKSEEFNNFIKQFINKMYYHIMINKKVDIFRFIWVYYFAKKHKIILEINEELKLKKEELKKQKEGLEQTIKEFGKTIKEFDNTIKELENKGELENKKELENKRDELIELKEKLIEKKVKLMEEELTQKEKELEKILKTDPFIQYIDNGKPIFDYKDDRLIIYKDTNYDDFIYNYVTIFGKKIK